MLGRARGAHNPFSDVHTSALHYAEVSNGKVGIAEAICDAAPTSSSRITNKPHLTPFNVGCCSRARVCLDRRSETQIFVDPAAFIVTNLSTRLNGR